jgi:signal transduction histidine kinase
LARENDQALIRIEDAGQGIDSIFLPRDFELFRQADASTSRAQSGVGIGLAVVHQLVDLHKGYRCFLGRTEQRAKFAIKLPLITAPKVFARASRRSSHFIG